MKYEVNGGCVVEVAHVHCAPVQVHVTGHLTHTALGGLPTFPGAAGLTDQAALAADSLSFLPWNNPHVRLYGWASM